MLCPRRGPFVTASSSATSLSGIQAPRVGYSTGWTFRLSPGERVALIGENGQGKTTIVKLISRLYDPTEGQILLDGIDLREYSIEDLCSEIGVIFQDFMRYEMTAAREHRCRTHRKAGRHAGA